MSAHRERLRLGPASTVTVAESGDPMWAGNDPPFGAPNWMSTRSGEGTSMSTWRGVGDIADASDIQTDEDTSLLYVWLPGMLAVAASRPAQLEQAGQFLREQMQRPRDQGAIVLSNEYKVLVPSSVSQQLARASVVVVRRKESSAREALSAFATEFVQRSSGVRKHLQDFLDAKRSDK